jgi:hypothetical protein
MSPAEVEREWDLYCGARTVEQALAGESNYPRTAEAIRLAVAEGAEARASELADAAPVPPRRTEVRVQAPSSDLP